MFVVVLLSCFAGGPGLRQGGGVLTHVPSEDGQQLAWGFGADVNQSALAEFNAWDLQQGWSAPSRPGVNYADLADWPVVSAPEEGWDLGLNNPRAVVLSMPKRTARRHAFKQQFQEVGWNMGASWAAGLDGTAMPERLKWLKGFVDHSTWDWNQAGTWGCYLAHLAVLRDHQAVCPTCDLIVFEDDVVFSPKFEQRWKSFLSKVPEDWSILRLGASALWEPSFEATPDYIHAKAVANRWGYVMRAKAVGRLADLLAGLPVKGNWGGDAVMQLFTDELKTYVPAVPLVHAVGFCHATQVGGLNQGCKEDNAASLQARVADMHAKWPQGYIRTYCSSKGVLHEAHKNHDYESVGCKDRLNSDTCCPYKDPPTQAM